MKKSITLSIILHLTLIGALFYTAIKVVNEGSGTGTRTGNSDENAQIASKPIEVFRVPPEKKSKLKKRVKLPNKKRAEKKECDRYFGGIGIMLSPSGDIYKSYPGYPAYKAGIRSGDVIVEASDEIRGPIGTSLTMIVQRGQDRYQVTVIRDKICLTNDS